MAYNENLANKIREALVEQQKVEEKKMFSGLCFMVNDKMCICVRDDKIMCRLDPEIYDAVLEENDCHPMIHGGRTMKGFVYVSDDVIKTQKDLDYWVGLALEYNKKSKVAPKKVAREKPTESALKGHNVNNPG